MAEVSTTMSAPVAAVKTELYYKTKTGTEAIQIFGVQSLPKIITPKEDVPYRTLESETEFAGKGIRAYESIEVELIGPPEQFSTLKAIADTDEELTWYIKMPAQFKTESKATVITWNGGLDTSIGELSPGDMIKTVIKIGKTSVPTVINALPTTP